MNGSNDSFRPSEQGSNLRLASAPNHFSETAVLHAVSPAYGLSAIGPTTTLLAQKKVSPWKIRILIDPPSLPKEIDGSRFQRRLPTAQSGPATPRRLRRRVFLAEKSWNYNGRLPETGDWAETHMSADPTNIPEIGATQPSESVTGFYQRGHCKMLPPTKRR